VLLRLPQSFLGREDHGLFARLLRELPAILNWAVAGWGRLAARGRFVQPASAQQSIEALADLTSPIGAFLRDCTITGARRRVDCDSLFVEWVTWCQRQGRDHPGNAQTFGRDLRAVLPAIKVSRPRRKGLARVRCYVGVGLATRADSHANGAGAWAAPRADR
jgi:putative DNA primase/helicase